MEIVKLTVPDLHRLTELFDYRDPEEMIATCTRDIQMDALIFSYCRKQIPCSENCG